jgi:hypothetical protein
LPPEARASMHQQTLSIQHPAALTAYGRVARCRVRRRVGAAARRPVSGLGPSLLPCLLPCLTE